MTSVTGRMKPSLARYAALLVALSTSALCQLSSLPTKENFLRRAFHRTSIRGDFLYIDGGELNQIDYSSGSPTPVVNTQNTTLSIDLRSSWTNDTVTINSIDKGNAPVLNSEWLFNDPDGKTFYVWGGYVSPTVSRPDPGNTLWAFTANDNGGGSWKSHGKVPSSLNRNSGALVTSSNDGVGYAVGGSGPGGPVQGIVAYDISSQTWTNGSTSEISPQGTAVDGQLVGTSAFGPDGILIALDGADGTTGEVETLNDFSTVQIYDRKSGNWLTQKTSGTPPAKRVSFCSVSNNGNSSYEIFIMGGWSGSTAYDDVHVLSLPSFSWYKADYVPGVGRTLHSCRAFGRQMLVVGGTTNTGSWLTGNSVTGTYADPWPWGLGVFDMSAMQWSSQFDANAQPYVTPDAVLTGIKANNNQPSSWDSNDVKQLFSVTTLSPLSSSSSSSSSGSGNGSAPVASSSSSGLSKGAIAGIAIGAVALLLLVAVALFWVWRNKRRSRAGHNPYPRGGVGPQNGIGDGSSPQYQSKGPGNHFDKPFVEVDGSPRPVELEQGGGARQFVGGPVAHEKMGRGEESQWRHELP